MNSDKNSANTDWHIHTCPHCDGKFKVSATSTDAQMACPHCNEVVSLRAEKSPTPIKATPEEESRVPKGLKNTADISKKPPQEKDADAEKEADSDSHHRSRSKSSKKPAEITWDSEKRAAEAEDEVSEYYTSDPNDPNAIRIKRIRKKKNLTPGQKVVRYSALAVGALVVIGTGIFIAMTFIQQVDIVANNDENLPQPEKEAVVDLIPPNPTEGEKERCLAIISEFLNAKTVDERVALVRTPDRVRPFLEAIHPKNGLEKLEGATMILIDKKEIDKERYFISLAIAREGVEIKTENTHFVSFEQTPDTILLDWEVSSKYQEMSFLDYLAKAPKQPVTFRVKVEKSDLLIPPNDDDEKFYPVVITYPGDPNFRMIGYFDKTTNWGLKFEAKLEFEAPSVVADIRLVDRIPEPYVEITNVRSDSWFMD